MRSLRLQLAERSEELESTRAVWNDSRKQLETMRATALRLDEAHKKKWKEREAGFAREMEAERAKRTEEVSALKRLMEQSQGLLVCLRDSRTSIYLSISLSFYLSIHRSIDLSIY